MNLDGGVPQGAVPGPGPFNAFISLDAGAELAPVAILHGEVLSALLRDRRPCRGI